MAVGSYRGWSPLLLVENAKEENVREKRQVSQRNYQKMVEITVGFPHNVRALLHSTKQEGSAVDTLEGDWCRPVCCCRYLL